MKGVLFRLLSSGTLALALAACGGGAGTETTGRAEPVLNEGSVTLGDTEYPFRVTTCMLGNSPTSKDFVILGRGTTPEGLPFDVEADGNAHTVEMRVKNAEGLPVGIYSASFDDSPFAIVDKTVSANGTFRRISIGGEVAGRFLANCG